MIQIWVSESIDKPFISRVDGETPQLNLNTTLSFEEIRSFLGEQLSDNEWDAVYRLWSEDSTERIFSQQNDRGDFLIEFRNQ